MIESGFCELAVVPVRREPFDRAEMTTQLLFGDLVEVIGREDSWCQVKIHFDGIDGLLETAQGYISCPYLWKGKTHLGLDCSGFTQVVFKQPAYFWITKGSFIAPGKSASIRSTTMGYLTGNGTGIHTGSGCCDG